MLRKKTEINDEILHHQYEGPWNIRVEKLVVAPDPYCEDPDCDYDELVFYIPSDWLIKWLQENGYNISNQAEMKRWLSEEYTSEDSENIWNNAVNNNQIVHYELY